jgi:hypothetical protein
VKNKEHSNFVRLIADKIDIFTAVTGGSIIIDFEELLTSTFIICYLNFNLSPIFFALSCNSTLNHYLITSDLQKLASFIYLNLSNFNSKIAINFLVKFTIPIFIFDSLILFYF